MNCCDRRAAKMFSGPILSTPPNKRSAPARFTASERRGRPPPRCPGRPRCHGRVRSFGWMSPRPPIPECTVSMSRGARARLDGPDPAASIYAVICMYVKAGSPYLWLMGDSLSAPGLPFHLSRQSDRGAVGWPGSATPPPLPAVC